MTGTGSSCSSDDNLLDDSNDEACSTTINRPLGLTGLQNLGNTCYMNAALQALSNCPQLTGFMTDCKEFIRKPGIAMTYQKLIQDMWSSKRPSYLTPHNVSMSIRKICPSFKAYTQQDAQEFLRCLLDQLHEDLKEPIFECTTCSRETLLTSSNHLNCNTSATASTITTTNATTTTSAATTELSSPNASCLMSLSQHSSLNMHQQQQQQPQPQSPSSPPPQQQQPGPGGHQQPGGSSSSNQHAHFHSIISEIFDGKILSCVQCLTCNNLSVTRETFQDLSLPIPTRDQLNVLRASRSKANSESESRSEDGASGRSSPISMSPLSSAGSSNSISSQQQQQQQQLKQDTYAWIWSWVEWLFSLFWGPTVELEDCLSAFFSADELKGDNMYSCEKCGKLRNGIKYSKVISLPDILCIHLKRFRHEFMYSSKISSQVTFPLDGLDMAPYMAPYNVIDPEKQTQALAHQRSASMSTMSPFSQHSSNLLISRSRVSSVSMSTTEATACDTVMTELSANVDGDTTSATIGESSLTSDTLGESSEATYGTPPCNLPQSPMQLEQITTYDLVAVICHHGTPASGHYIAYCLNSTSDTWYEFDDQYVTAVDPHQVASCEAYVLFYRKTNDEVCQRRLRTVELIERCNSSAASTESSSKKSSRSEPDLDLLGRYFISNKWINRFNTFADPGPITNHDFLCEHHAVRPSQSNYVHHLCTMFSKEVWDYLVSKYGGGPACTSLDVCTKCDAGLSIISKFYRNIIPPHATSAVVKTNHSPSHSDQTRTNGTSSSSTPSVTSGSVVNKTAPNSTNNYPSQQQQSPLITPSPSSKLTDTNNTPAPLPMDTNE